MKNLALSSQMEHSLLLQFLQFSSIKKAVGIRLEAFCQEYRDLSLGSSFLNAAHSTKWLDTWKNTVLDQGKNPAALVNSLQAARSWTGFLFEQKVLDDDALYLKVRPFLDGRTSTVQLDVNLQSVIRSHRETMEAQFKAETVRIYLATLHDFNVFQAIWPDREPGWPGLESQKLLGAWIRSQIGRVDERNAAVRLGVVRELLEVLRSQGLIANNPVDLLLEVYPRRGRCGLVVAFSTEEPAAALEELMSPDRFTSHWGPAMVEWIRLKRSLGAGFGYEELTLAQLDRYLEQTGEDTPVSPKLITEWLTSLPGITSHAIDKKRRFAKNFFDYAIRQGHLTSNPALFRSGQVERKLPPFIYSHDQILEILRRAKEMRDIPFFPNRGATYATMFAMLYCLGLRIREACRLCVEDIDLKESLVHIRKTKFYKSRILPIGPKIQELLDLFLQVRRTRPEAEPLGPVFIGRYGRPVCRWHVGSALNIIVGEMGLQSQVGHRSPCLHSFRHTFALHRLIRWYREGATVQAKLPLLSAYLGHVDIASTEVYLEANFALLEAANERFESQFGRATWQEGHR